MISSISSAIGYLNPYNKKSIFSNFPFQPSPTSKRLALYALAAGSLLYTAYITLQPRSVTDIFPENLCKNATLSGDFCLGNLGIPRSMMPQLEGAVKKSFLHQYLASCAAVDPLSLRSTQSEVDLGKVMAIVRSALDGSFNPCDSGIITAIGLNNTVQVVDGHHRAAACYYLANMGVSFAQQIFINHICLPIANVIAAANSFEGVEQHGFGYYPE